MVHDTLHKDLKLYKSTKWVPKLLDKEMKKKRARMRKAIMSVIATSS
jgi:hypothetical protein